MLTGGLSQYNNLVFLLSSPTLLSLSISDSLTLSNLSISDSLTSLFLSLTPWISRKVYKGAAASPSARLQWIRSMLECRLVPPSFEQLFHRHVQRFRGGLVVIAHRLCVSLNSRLGSNNLL